MSKTITLHYMFGKAGIIILKLWKTLHREKKQKLNTG